VRSKGTLNECWRTRRPISSKVTALVLRVGRNRIGAELTAGVFGFWFIYFLISTTLVTGELKTLI